ncbi:DUF1361 domain-containing protein [Sediminibacterium ginsengisoli]|uniref:Uncharacterized membrane protein n=1 Tax=Sediminibacterium ginsengisoli TaxID=413434 RepID=A0A1T4NJD4_9BACT|nr:DUF1361 domain-containing protein [Sediminibacterium ginsengisoli]SJZ79147.1 Uncharacterized membrane protein [Sediminibacterium ginsengisoli]
MKLHISGLSKMLLLSCMFTMVLLFIRIIWTGQPDYGFYPWNTFLAAIPYIMGCRLQQYNKLGPGAFATAVIWLLFLPNAPYLLTDIFHFEERPGFPVWFDMIMVSSGSWNGLILGVISLMQFETFLAKLVKPFWVKVGMFTGLLLCSYGIFIGRYLRFNSWDVFTSPKMIISSSAHHFLLPHHYISLWAFTFLFTVLLCVVYFTVKKLPRLLQAGQ